MPADDLLIDTQGLVKNYHGRNVVDGVSIHVKRGEVVGLLGPNGAARVFAPKGRQSQADSMSPAMLQGRTCRFNSALADEYG